MAAHRIAVVEGEADLREVVVAYLRAQGFDPLPCPDTTALDAVLSTGPVEAVLLDLNLPQEGGIAVARRLRALPTPPVILMVAAPGVPRDRVVADDYLGKPFEMRELLAHLRGVLRLRAAAPATSPPPATPEIRFGTFRLVPAERRLLDARGAAVPLTPMELDLLLILTSQRGRVFSREHLLRLSHGRAPDPFDRSIDIRVTRLRRKIEPDPANPLFIRTVRGQGYLFSADD